MNTGTHIKCYWGSGSAPSWRVLICLKEKSLHDANLILLSMSDNEHKAPDVLKINPRGQLPAFQDGDVIINESIAICHYLADTYDDQGSALFPKDAIQRGLVYQRIHEIQNLYGKVMNLTRYYWKRKPYYTNNVVSEKKAELMIEIKLWDTYINNGFVVGSEFSLADVCLFPVIAFMNRLGMDLSAYPQIDTFYNRHITRQSIQETWPPHWKESRNKTIFKRVL